MCVNSRLFHLVDELLVEQGTEKFTAKAADMVAKRKVVAMAGKFVEVDSAVIIVDIIGVISKLEGRLKVIALAIEAKEFPLEHLRM